MTLRSLIFNLEFQGNSSAVLEMDTAVDTVKENVGEATEKIDTMESSTTTLGETTKKQGGFIANNWKKITAGLAAVSVVAEKFTRDNAKLTESLGKVSRATGIGDDELKKLTLRMTNVTFPLEDVTELMSIASQQGLKSADELEAFGFFWDMVGDATGLSGPSLALAGTGLRAVGIAAGEESKALAAFGYITQSTSGSVDEFLNFLDKTGPQLRSMGADIDDSAAMLGILEREFGMSGRTARQEFRTAVNAANGDMGKMLRTLGISEEMFGEYTEAVAGSSEVIQENADAHAETYTVTQKLSQKVKELAFNYSGALSVVSSFAPVLMAIGPIMGGISAASTFLSGVNFAAIVPSFTASAGAAWAFTAALLANPITWIVIAVVGLGVAIWALYNDIGGVTTKIKAVLGKVANWLKKTFGPVLDWIVNLPAKIKQGIGNAVSWIVGKAKSLIGFFTGIPQKFKEIGKNILDGFIQGINDKIAAVKDAITGIGDKISGWFKGVLGISSPSKIFGDFGRNTMDGFMGGLEERASAMKDKITGIASNVGGWFKDKLGISSPSKVMIEAGYDTGKGVELGIDKSRAGIERSSIGLAQQVDNDFSNVADSINNEFKKGIQSNSLLGGTGESLTNIGAVNDTYAGSMQGIAHTEPPEPTLFRERNIYNAGTQSNRQITEGAFSPTLNINITGNNNAKETAYEIKLQFEKLMAQYNKRNNLKAGRHNV